MTTKRHHWRRWNRSIIFAFILSGIGIALMNVLVDPYEVFRLIPYRSGYTPNEWDNKLVYLKDHPEKVETIYLGSSRMGIFDPLWLESRHPGHHAYNLSKLAGQPSDATRLLPALSKLGLTPQEIWLGLDIFSFVVALRNRGPAHFDPPDISGEEPVHFLGKYIFLPSFKQALTRLQHAFADKPNVVFNFERGYYRTPGLIRLRDKDPKTFEKREFSPRKVNFVGAKLIQSELDALREIADWARDNHVRVKAFIHPHHKVVQAQMGAAAFDELRSRSEMIFGQVLDLTHYTDEMGNSAFIDHKHYTPNIAEKITALIDTWNF